MITAEEAILELKSLLVHSELKGESSTRTTYLITKYSVEQIISLIQTQQKRISQSLCCGSCKHCDLKIIYPRYDEDGYEAELYCLKFHKFTTQMAECKYWERGERK